MKKLKCYVVFFFFGFFLSCDRTPNDVKYPILNSHVKDAATFKLGSYFIFQDSTSGLIDSFWVNLSYQFYVTELLGDDHYEYIETAGYTFINKDSILGSVGTDGRGSVNDNYKIQGRIYNRPVNYYSSHFILNKINSDLYYSSGYNVYPNYYDSIVINGQLFLNVLESYNKSITSLITNDSVAVTSYYSLEQGIIKFTMRTDTSYHSWELIQNHIIH